MIKQLSLQELEEWRLEGRPFRLIDVREDDEREVFHIGGEHMPFGSVQNNFKPINSNEIVVFYCRHGVRSRLVISRLQSLYPDAQFYNLSGGIGDQE